MGCLHVHGCVRRCCIPGGIPDNPGGCGGHYACVLHATFPLLRNVSDTGASDTACAGETFKSFDINMRDRPRQVASAGRHDDIKRFARRRASGWVGRRCVVAAAERTLRGAGNRSSRRCKYCVRPVLPATIPGNCSARLLCALRACAWCVADYRVVTALTRSSGPATSRQQRTRVIMRRAQLVAAVL